ncbi:MAG: PA0069 family radical SAM protein [Burkholderiaceae bacterium]
MPTSSGPERKPVRIVKGRGAVGNPAGRFETLLREPVDDGWFGESGEPAPLETVVTDERARSIVTRNQSPDVPFDLSINPYRGCEHGCVYCFARPNHSYLGLSPGTDFERRLFAKVNAAALLVEALAAPGYRCQPINVGSATDAYQPIERERGITREVLQVLSDCRHPFSVITKSALIERDLDLLAPMARDGLASAYVTITTLDPELARRWEPRAAAPWRRLETIRRLSEAGVPVGVSVAPVAPFLNEPELESILAAAREAGATSAITMVLRLPWELEEVFVDWLRAHFPERAERVLNRLRDMRETGEPGGRGRLNDPRFHTRMRGRGHWADLIRLRYEVAVRRLGLNRDRFSLRTDLFVPPRSDGQLGLFQAEPPPA